MNCSNDDQLPLILGIAGLATAVLALGLVIGFLLNRNTQRQPNSTGGYSIERDERSRITGIIQLPIPTPTTEGMWP